jgi:hypothetical protein
MRRNKNHYSRADKFLQNFLVGFSDISAVFLVLLHVGYNVGFDAETGEKLIQHRSDSLEKDFSYSVS